MRVPAAARHVLLAASFLVLSTPRAPLVVTAEEDGFEAAWKGRTDSFVGDLEALADWCHKRKVFRARNDTYEWVLHFAPDHADARKWLKYKREDDGSWSRPAGYRRPRNMAAGKSAEWERRRAALGEAFATDALSLLSAHAAGVSSVRRARVIRDLLLVAPAREALRELNGEVRLESGDWVLLETRAARGRRAVLPALARAALARAPRIEASRPTSAENALQIAWAGIVDGPHVRVLSTVSAEDARACALRAEACFRFFEAVFDQAPPRLTDFRLHVVADPGSKQTLLDRHPASSGAYRDWARPLSSGWFPRTDHLFVASRSEPARREWCVRQPVSRLLRRAFGVSTKQGWIFEGVGVYLGRHLTGRTQTFFVRPTTYERGREPKAGPLWDRLKAEDADWLAEARALMRSDLAPDLHLLLGKTVNTMNTEDMLAGWVLAAYVLEGRPEQAAPLFLAFGKRKRSADDALREVLGLDADLLAVRLRRWLEELR